MGLGADLAAQKKSAAKPVSTGPAYEGDQFSFAETGRALAGGLTMGFWDEIEAAARSAVNGFSDYEETRNKIRQEMKAYADANPGTALTAEVIGAMAPTVALMLVPGGQAAAGTNVARLGGLVSSTGAKQLATVGAVEGGATAIGKGEDGLVQDIMKAPGGAATGAVTNVAGGKLMSGVTGLAGDFMNFARKKLQGRPTGVVESEIQRLMDLSGKEADEVINDLLDGRIMADNPMLAATLREYRTKGGTVDLGRMKPDGTPVRTDLKTATTLREQQIRGEAAQEIQEGLTPGVTDNTLKAFKESDKAFAKRESEAYREIFSNPDLTVSKGTIDAITDAFNRIPDLPEIIQSRLVAEGKGKIVPFYKVMDDGSIKILRQPSVEDVEVVRRAVQKKVDQAYDPMNTQVGSDLGESFKEIEQNIRTRIDMDAPELGATRQGWSILSQSRKQFDEGKKIWGKNPDEIEYNYDLLGNADPAVRRAYRAGAMTALRNKIKRQPGIFEKISNPNSADHAILRTIFPGENIDDVLRKAGLAADVKAVKDIVSPVRQSITADQLAARANEGAGPIGAFDLAGAAMADPQAIARISRTLAGEFKVELSPQQRNQVIDVLFSEDPELVRKMIEGGGLTEQQMAKAGKVINAVLTGGRAAAVENIGASGGDLSGTIYQEIFGP